MSIFVKNLEDLLYLSNKKVTLVKHLQKNYRENVHYIIQKDNFKNIKKTAVKTKYYSCLLMKHLSY